MGKRLYELSYKDTDEPVWFEHAGSLLKLSGILVQGMGSSILLLSPNRDIKGNIDIVRMGAEEWSEFLRRTDDPLLFLASGHGSKVVVRKQQYAISGKIQQMIWARDGFRCMYCGRKMGEVQLTVDHFVPLQRGGMNNEKNYVSACRRCNTRKGSQLPKDFCESMGYDYKGLQLYIKRKAPRSFIAHLAKFT
jgi:hypothetical protein